MVFGKQSVTMQTLTCAKPVLRAAVLLVVVALLLVPLNLRAQIQVGEYVHGAGFGILYVMAKKDGSLHFQLGVRGANFHMCDLAGQIRNGEARMEDSSDDKLPCIVTFKAEKDGIAVGSTHGQTCNAYCGVRAWFEGHYALPPAGCAPTRVARIRRDFKAAYDAKRYTEARALLLPVAEKCSATMSDLDGAWVRNDLALTHYRNGDRAACIAVLRPWLELAQTPDDTIRGDYPPSDAAEMLRIAQATRANMKLCGEAVTLRNQSRQ